MNKDLQDFARKKLKDDLLKCNKNEQAFFKRMYGNLKFSINRVVDDMADDKLDWAMEQVKRTLNKKKSDIKFSSAWAWPG